MLFIVIHINILKINLRLNLIKMYSNIMTFDIKTINRKNIENNLNTCLDITNMLVELKKKYDKKI